MSICVGQAVIVIIIVVSVKFKQWRKSSDRAHIQTIFKR